jgi:hypothetical protein
LLRFLHPENRPNAFAFRHLSWRAAIPVQPFREIHASGSHIGRVPYTVHTFDGHLAESNRHRKRRRCSQLYRRSPGHKGKRYRCLTARK